MITISYIFFIITTHTHITGIPKVGLSSSDLETLANPSDKKRNGRTVLKVCYDNDIEDITDGDHKDI